MRSTLKERVLKGVWMLCCGSSLLSAHAAGTSFTKSPRLEVYFVDVEGGQATLFVTPDHHSLLVDTGWPGNNGRDADRILAVARQAGISSVDDVLLTHYHVDHAGGVGQLVQRLPVKVFLDHGPNRELDGGVTEKSYAEYQKVLEATGAQRRTLRAGEQLSVGDLHLRVISSDGQLIAQALPGAGRENSFCANSEQRPPDLTENSRSLGVELQYGALTLLDLGDLTWDKERDLMCPKNKLGRVDVLIVSHHGWYQSSSPALVRAVEPRVAVMDNGEHKGGSKATLQTLHGIPLWQLHASAEGGTAWNTPVAHIANPLGEDHGWFLELSAAQDGSFTVFNPRTQRSEQYPVDPHAENAPRSAEGPTRR